MMPRDEVLTKEPAPPIIPSTAGMRRSREGGGADGEDFEAALASTVGFVTNGPMRPSPSAMAKASILVGVAGEVVDEAVDVGVGVAAWQGAYRVRVGLDVPEDMQAGEKGE